MPDFIDGLLGKPQFDQLLLKLGKWVALLRLFQIITVPFLANTARVVPQKWNFAMQQPWSSIFSDISKDVMDDIITGHKISTVDAFYLNAWVGFCQCSGIAKSYFRGMRADVPFIVLNKIQNGQLLQRSHVQGFRNFAFCH